MAIKKKKRKKANTLAILLSVVLSLLLIIIVLALTNQPSSLLKAQTGPTCSDKSIVLKFGPITGQPMTARTSRYAKSLAFDVARIAMMTQWNNTEGATTVEEANQKLDCAAGQSHCTQKDVSAYCRPRTPRINDCNFSPLTNTDGSYTDTATCTAAVNCMKSCIPATDESLPTPLPFLKRCTAEDSCRSPSSLTTPIKTSQAKGEEIPASYPVQSVILVQAIASAKEAAKAAMGCIEDEEPTHNDFRHGVTEFSTCQLKPDADPTGNIIQSSIDCPDSKVLLIKAPPESNTVQYKAMCAYQCEYKWPCELRDTSKPPKWPGCSVSNSACDLSSEARYQIENSATATTTTEAIRAAIYGDGTPSNLGLRDKCNKLIETKPDPMGFCNAYLASKGIKSTTNGCAVGCAPVGKPRFFEYVDWSSCEVSTLLGLPYKQKATCYASCSFEQECKPEATPPPAP